MSWTASWRAQIDVLFARHPDLDAHFAGRSSTRADRRLYGHIKSCSDCRDRYRTLAMLEALESDGAERARARMARGLFEPAPRRAFAGGGLVLAFACLVLVVSLGRVRSPFRGDGFSARGGASDLGASLPSLSIYRVPRDSENPALPAVAETQRAGNLMHAGESLAFTYSNPASVGDGWLMVFARDAAGHVFWFWPAWDNGADDPQSVPAQANGVSVELPEAVRHELTPGQLTVVGLFTPKPLHVKEVEAAIAGGLDGLQAFPGHVWTESLEVSR
ncbi:MAG TPA: hypothetical protein VHK47_19065 [Polyangia bacterium]|jgi:hypothetical protein|nr:hypothetical protein [Polyangia bacterium]